MANMINLEVAYALPQKQKIVSVSVDEGSSLLDAVMQSGIDKEFPELNFAAAKYGIFGKAVRNPEQEIVREGIRIEIYRPLLIDPKQARLNRAAKVQQNEE